MLTQKEKTVLLKAIKDIDVKKMSIEHPNKTIEKWYRFGNYNAFAIVTEIIKNLPEA